MAWLHLHLNPKSGPSYRWARQAVGLCPWARWKAFWKVPTSAKPQRAAMLQKSSIIGALNLYLDFINIFLYVVRLLGRRDN